MKGNKKKFKFLSRSCRPSSAPSKEHKASLTNVRQNMSSDNSFSRKYLTFLASLSSQSLYTKKYWQKIHSVAEPRVVLFKSHCDDKTKFGCCRWIRYRNKWRRKEPECGLKCISRQNYLHELLSGRIAADSAILVLAGEINIGFQITKNGMKRKLAITD